MRCAIKVCRCGYRLRYDTGTSTVVDGFYFLYSFFVRFRFIQCNNQYEYRVL